MKKSIFDIFVWLSYLSCFSLFAYPIVLLGLAMAAGGPNPPEDIIEKIGRLVFFTYTLTVVLGTMLSIKSRGEKNLLLGICGVVLSYTSLIVMFVLLKVSGTI